MNDPVTPIDIRNCYRLALGRDPGSQNVIAGKVRQPRAGLLPDFSSSEFEDGVRPKLGARELSHPAFRTPPGSEFKAWVADFVPLSAAGAQAAEDANGWYALHYALFTVPVFAGDGLTEQALVHNAAFVAALAHHERLNTASRIEGQFDLIAPHEIPLGVPRAALDGRGAGKDVSLDRLILRLVAERGRDGVVHIPRVLSHALAPPSPAPETRDARRETLQDHPKAFISTAVAEAPHDPLDAFVPGAFRIRRPLPPDIRTAVIIPTRDRLDLLAPCLTSLAARLPQNRARLEMVVVDNQSEGAETHAFLDQLARTAPLRVLRHDGAFNWALINNRAAAAVQADVLIFLNNDTAAFTPDWCDELCSQALRTEVGAVGARLLYADGSIQHPGMVTGGWRAFTEHEGRGAPGRRCRLPRSPRPTPRGTGGHRRVSGHPHGPVPGDGRPRREELALGRQRCGLLFPRPGERPGHPL